MTGAREEDDALLVGDLSVLVVRDKVNRRLVGIFAIPMDENDLLEYIDEVCDPSYCEYAVIPMFYLLWEEDQGPVFPDIINVEDTEDRSFGEPWFGELTLEYLHDIEEWRPFVSGWIYFIRAGEFVKIGYSLDVPTRLAALQTSSPHPLYLLHSRPGTKKDEASYHQQFAHLRERGEWFRFEGELRAYLEGLQ